MFMLLPVEREGALSPESDLQMHLYRPISRPDDADTSFAALLQDALADVSIDVGEDIPCLPAEDPRFAVVSKSEMQRVYASFRAMYRTGSIKDFDDHLFQWINAAPRETVDGIPQSINMAPLENGWWNIVLGFRSETSDEMRKKIYDRLTVRKNPAAQFIQPKNYSVVMASIQPEGEPLQFQNAMLRKISSRISPIALGPFGMDVSFRPPRRIRDIG